MSFYDKNLTQTTLENDNYRKVLDTTSTTQLVLMSLRPQEEIGWEIHKGTTQYFFIEDGVGLALTGSKPDYFVLTSGSSLIVNPGTRHNIINISNHKDLKLRTMYSPPQHPKDTLQKYKQTEY